MPLSVSDVQSGNKENTINSATTLRSLPKSSGPVKASPALSAVVPVCVAAVGSTTPTVSRHRLLPPLKVSQQTAAQAVTSVTKAAIASTATVGDQKKPAQAVFFAESQPQDEKVQLTQIFEKLKRVYNMLKSTDAAGSSLASKYASMDIPYASAETTLMKAKGVKGQQAIAAYIGFIDSVKELVAIQQSFVKNLEEYQGCHTELTTFCKQIQSLSSVSPKLKASALNLHSNELPTRIAHLEGLIKKYLGILSTIMKKHQQRLLDVVNLNPELLNQQQQLDAIWAAAINANKQPVPAVLLDNDSKLTVSPKP